jgi:hypothetical protein
MSLALHATGVPLLGSMSVIRRVTALEAHSCPEACAAAGSSDHVDAKVALLINNERACATRQVTFRHSRAMKAGLVLKGSVWKAGALVQPVASMYGTLAWQATWQATSSAGEAALLQLSGQGGRC